MRRTSKWILTALLTLALMLPACAGKKEAPPAPGGGAGAGAGQPVAGGTLTWGSFSDIVSINPLFIDDVGSQEVANLVFAALYNIDAKGTLVADDWALAAELPKVTNDGKTYTIKLKPTPKWTDGKPVTADDVVFTFKAIADPEAGSPLLPYFDKVRDIKAQDPQTVQIDLKDVYAPFELNSLNINVVPAHILRDVPAAELQQNPFGKDPAKTVTSGAYTWKEWVQKQYHTFEANPAYWGKKPNIKTIVYKLYADQTTEVQALLKGEIDMMTAIPVGLLPAVQGKQAIAMIEQPGPNYDYLGYNFKDANFPGGKSLFTSAKVRQAIAYALNRQGMVDSVLKGHGKLINGPFLPGSWAETPGASTNYPYDPNKAKQLLAEEGWTPGADGILTKGGQPFEFELITNSGNSRREGIMAIIQQNLKDVGIKVNLKPLDFASMIDEMVTPGKFEAMLLGWSLSIDPDNESVFSSRYFPPTGQNVGWYKNERTDDLWVQGWKSTDQAQRKAVYAEIQKAFSTDPPYVFLAQQNAIMGLNKRVHFADADKPILSLPYGYMFHIQNWWVEQ